MDLALFWILGSTALISAFGVIVAKNTINSVMSLLVTMLALAGFYVLMDATAVALFQIIVYVGAVLVLFLFVIMLLNLRKAPPSISGKSLLWISVGASVGVITIIGWLLWRSATQVCLKNGPGYQEVSYSVHEISFALFSRHLLIFELTSLLLMVAAIGAILMTKHK